MPRDASTPVHIDKRLKAGGLGRGSPEPMENALQSILSPAIDHHLSLTVCGGSPARYASLLGRLMNLAPNEYSLALLGSEVECGVTHSALKVIQDSDLCPSAFCRSALRQDPDTIILDERAETADPMLLFTAKETGHRLILHRVLPVHEVHKQNVNLLNERLPGYAGSLLQYEVFLQFDDEGAPSEVWQAELDEQGGSRLALMAVREAESWNVRRPLLSREASQPPAEPEGPIMLPEEWAERNESLLDELRRVLAPHRKTAWGPVKTEEPVAALSRFGGLPRLLEGEDWPCCGACLARLPLIVQVELKSAPVPFQDELGSEGLFQFFYCTAPQCGAKEAWAPFQSNSLARVVRDATADPTPTDEAIYEPVAITGWTEFSEAPDSEEREHLWPEGSELVGSWSDALIEAARYPEDAESFEARYANILEYFEITGEQIPEIATYLGTARGDKILGWPAWTQGPSYPYCPTCGESMKMLIQLNNDGHGSGLPGHGSTYGQVFAADGNGHVFHCHGHLTFAWACS